MGRKHIFDASFAPQNSRPPLRQRPAKRAQLGQRIEGLHGVPFAVADGGGLADNPLDINGIGIEALWYLTPIPSSKLT